MTSRGLSRLLVLAAACAAVGCNGPTRTPPPATLTTYTFEVTGPDEDMPYYPAVYHRITSGAQWQLASRFPVVVGRRFEVRAAAGERWQARTEKDPSAAILRMMWQIDAEGTFGDETHTALPLPPRLRVTATAPPGTIGMDAVTFYDEATKTAAWALNDPHEALFEAVVQGKDRHSFMRRAEPRPFVADGFARGAYVVAGWVAGRHWVAERVDLSDRGAFSLDTGSAPAGGGAVQCETADAVLLLNRDLPIPCPVKRVDLTYRARWENVPPGDHAVRYPDGHVEDITVTEGGEVKLPRRP